MVLVEHDSTCRPRGFESVVFGGKQVEQVSQEVFTVWVDLNTANLDFILGILLVEMIVRVPLHSLFSRIRI